jgi:hypothetical protein
VCGQLGKLLELYRAHAPEAPALFGRAKALEKRIRAAEETSKTLDPS